jgi:hypothetical protein
VLVSVLGIKHVKEARSSLALTGSHLPSSVLKPKDRVRLAVNMVDVVTRICADGVRDANPTINEEELISVLRRRFLLGRRLHREE